jgi:hypothetical protein
MQVVYRASRVRGAPRAGVQSVLCARKPRATYEPMLREPVSLRVIMMYVRGPSW